MPRAALILLALAFAGHAPLLFREALSGTEGFRAQVGYEMARSGDLLVPTLGGVVKLTKPPLHYWMLAGMHELFGWNLPLLRLPSLLLIWLCGCALWSTLARRFDTPTAWVGAVSMLWAPQILWHGAFTEIDPGFAALTCMSVVWLAEGAVFSSRRALLAAGLAGGLALLDKGPPYFMFAAGALALLLQPLGLRRLLTFLLLVLLPTALYYAALFEFSRVDFAQFSAVAAAESVGRATGYDWNSLREIPAYLVRAAVILLPFTFWSNHSWPRRGEPSPAHDRFRRALTASTFGAVLILLVFPGRSSRYLLPAVAIFATAMAPALTAWVAALQPPQRAAKLALHSTAVLGALTLLALPWLPFPMPGRTFVGVALLAPAALLATRNRPATLAWLLLLPVVLVWTVRLDREEVVRRGVRAEQNSAALMAEIMDRFDVDEARFWGDPGERFAVLLDPDMRWERNRAAPPPDVDWLIQRVFDGETVDPALAADFAPRARVRGRDHCWVLLQRRG